MLTMEEKKAFFDKAMGKIVDDAGCWVWQGSTYTDRKCSLPMPHMGFDGESYNVRRILFEATNGGKPPAMKVMRTCEKTLCVNPDHAKLVTPKKLSQIAYENRRFTASEVLRLKKFSKHKREKIGKLDELKAAEIRTGELSDGEYAEKFNISRSLAQKVRTGIRWKSYSASPWQGLGA